MRDPGANRRSLLRAAGGAVAAVGLVGCLGDGSDRVADDYDPELAGIGLDNLDDDPHEIEMSLYRSPGTNRPGPEQSLLERSVELAPDDSEYLSEFPGRGRRFALSWRVDGGGRERFRTGEITGCTKLSFEIDENGDVSVSKRPKTVCYDQDG